MMVTDAGASVIFCLYPDAAYTESMSTFIRSSNLASNKFAGAWLTWASIRTGAKPISIKGKIKRRTRKSFNQGG